MLRLALGLLGLLLVTTTADAREWATLLGETTLSKSRIGVVARITKVVEIPGRRITLLRLAIDSVIWGQSKKRVLNAIVPEVNMTGANGRRLVVFLVPLRTNLRVINMFYLDGKPAEERLRVMRAYLKLERVEPGLRPVRHRALILEGLVSPNEWRFFNSMGELGKRIRDRRGLLEAGFRQKLNRLAFTLKIAKRQTELRRLLLLLPPAKRVRRLDAARSRPAGAESDKTGALTAHEAIARVERAKKTAERVLAMLALVRFPGAASERLLCGLLQGAALEQRRMAAFVLGEIGGKGAVKALIGALLSETDERVARQLIRALGLLRVVEAVSLLTQRLSRMATAQEAMLALARIRTPGALGAIKSFIDGAGSQAPYPALGRLSRYYLSQGFVERDRALRGR